MKTPARSVAIASIAYIGPDLTEKLVERVEHKTLRGLQLRLLSLAESHFGAGCFKTVPDSSLVGFRCVDSEGNTLGLAIGSEMGIL